MRSRSVILLFFLLTISVIPGCQKEDKGLQNVPAPSGAKLKSILIFPGIDATNPEYIESEYEYDSLDRISRVTHPAYENGVQDGIREYEIYQYDPDGRLNEISNYHYNSTPGNGFINIWNRIYTYSADGRLYKVSTNYNASEYDEYSVYHYENNRVALTENYTDGGKLENYTLNEYNKQGELIKESVYTSDNQLQAYTDHNYSGGLQVLSEVYNTFPQVFMIRKIERNFDRNGNLEILVSRELAPWSSQAGYKLKYEYY